MGPVEDFNKRYLGLMRLRSDWETQCHPLLPLTSQSDQKKCSLVDRVVEKKTGNLL